MNAPPSGGAKSPVVHLKTKWKLKHNPFPQSGIAVLGGDDERENGMLFRPEVQQEDVAQAIDKFVLGAAYSGLKFGYLWSLSGSSEGGDARGYGKSSLLQYLVERINADFGRGLLLEAGLDEEDADESPIAATMASFDMANSKSLAAVFYEATRYACRFRTADHPTLARRMYERLRAREGTDNKTALVEKVMETADEIRGRTLGPPKQDFLDLLCAGEEKALARGIEEVKEGARGRVQSANYLATLLLFARAAGIPHVLLGCDQLEDFASTSTSRQKRTVETERFRDFVLELQPMADMLSVIVTLHPRAEVAIRDMWALADLPDLRYDLPQNDRHVVILREIDDAKRARSLLEPYMEAARKNGSDGDSLWPLSEQAVLAIADHADGKPREILRKAHAVLEHGAAENWDEISGEQADEFLRGLNLDDEEDEVDAIPSPMESEWSE